MNRLEAIYHLFDDLATLFRNISPLSQKIYLFYLYLFLKLKGIILIRLLHLKIDRQRIFNHLIYFPNFFEFVRIFTDIFIWKFYQFETKNPKPKIIDCGANIGLASLYFKLKYPTSEAICFEPSKQAFKFLAKNLSSFQDITLVNAALHKYGRSKVFLTKPKDAPIAFSGTTIFPSRWQTVKLSREEARTVKLSSFIYKNEVVDFLKLDVEGAETQVLEDLNQSQKLKQIKQMYVEYHHLGKNNSLAKITSILENNGFKVIVFGGARSPFPVYRNKFYFLHLFAYRN